MKQKVSPVMVAVIVLVLLGVIGAVGYSIFKGKGDSGDSNQTIVKLPADTDNRFKAHLPPNVGGGGG